MPENIGRYAAYQTFNDTQTELPLVKCSQEVINELLEYWNHR